MSGTGHRFSLKHRLTRSAGGWGRVRVTDGVGHDISRELDCMRKPSGSGCECATAAAWWCTCGVTQAVAAVDCGFRHFFAISEKAHTDREQDTVACLVVSQAENYGYVCKSCLPA